MKTHVVSGGKALLADAYVKGLSVVSGRSSSLVPLAVVAAVAVALPLPANAAGGGSDPSTMINNVCTFILGPFGQSLAVLGIIAIGLSWMFGRVSLGLIAGVIGGIVIMFGASFLGSTLTGGTGG